MNDTEASRPLVLFRVDATKANGVGHAMRCLALAQAWKDSGGEACFAMESSVGFFDEALAGEGFEKLSCEPRGGDALNAAGLAVRRGVEWAVLDGYHFGPKYEEAFREAAPGVRLLVIDDRLRRTAADLFVVPTSLVDRKDWQQGAKLLGGWHFALLRREFRRPARLLSKEPPEILVVFGGTDSADMTPAVADSLGRMAGEKGWKVKVVSAGALPDSVHRLVPGKEIFFHMQRAAVVVCTASTLALEACACGVPQVLLTVADNQVPVAGALCSAGTAVMAETAGQIVDSVLEILEGGRSEQMGLEAAALVDGQGACRLANAMLARDFSLRPVGFEDSEKIRRWANDPVARQASFQQGEILRDVHEKWFRKRLEDPACWMRIAVDEAGRDFGLLRIESETEAVLSISLQSTHRGLGLGEKLLSKGCAAFFRECSPKTIRAEVKPGNTASVQAFKKAGFSIAQATGDRVVFHLSSS